MYVIFPAEDLILMTYGAAIPRISPRPTLDCLREPQVPIVIPPRSQRPPNQPASSIRSPVTQYTPPTPPQARILPAVQTSFVTTTIPEENEEELLQDLQQPENYIPNDNYILTSHVNQFPTPPQSPLPCSPHDYRSPYLPSNTPPATPSRRGSKTSLQRTSSLIQHRAPLEQRNLIGNSLSNIQEISSTAAIRTTTYNDLSAVQSAHTLQQPNLQQSSYSTQMGSSQRPNSSASHYNEDPSHRLDYPTGSLAQSTRERSPSIFLEPPTPPTIPRLGPGWGRPMSPMDLPPEPSYTPSKPTTSKGSRLRPKLHIPLGRLGKSSSSEQKESNRLREDLDVRVENPVFNTENLRQRNFDAFFDAGEAKYRIHPKTPNAAAGDAGAMGNNAIPPRLDNYAGVYDSPRKGRNAASGGGGLFARSSKEKDLNAARSKSMEQYDPERDIRASSLGPTGSVASLASAGSGGATAAVPQKGDRFLGKIFKWSKKS